jgi:hypothetical protein
VTVAGALDELCAVGVLTSRSITSGVGFCFAPRPIKTPATSKAIAAKTHRSNCERVNLAEHVSQKRLLVQKRQRSRTIFSPHSEQKFGR